MNIPKEVLEKVKKNINEENELLLVMKNQIVKELENLKVSK